MEVIEITGKEALDILNHSHPLYKTIENELEDVDDHGDATRYVIFQLAADRFFRFYYVQQKEQGAMINDSDIIECDRVKSFERTVIDWVKV